METTRTSSPYFSPNRASAPAFTASSGVISRVVTASLWRMRSVDVFFDGADVVGRERLRLAEIEAQAVGRHQRALLGDVIAEAAAQRLVQQMGGGVVGAQRRAARAVDAHLQRIADGDAALGHRAQMDMEIAELLLGVVDDDLRALAART